MRLRYAVDAGDFSGVGSLVYPVRGGVEAVMMQLGLGGGGRSGADAADGAAPFLALLFSLAALRIDLRALGPAAPVQLRLAVKSRAVLDALAGTARAAAMTPATRDFVNCVRTGVQHLGPWVAREGVTFVLSPRQQG
jgi:hypothetical protein